MLLIFFFYGLAFILMGVIVFSMPKRNYYFGLSDDLWLFGVFGILHGFNEWVDLLILLNIPGAAGILNACGALLLPVSFLFMAAFGGNVLSKKLKRAGYLKYIWVALFAVWAVSSAAMGSVIISSIFARYLICFPGAILAALGLSAVSAGCRENNTPKTACSYMQIAIAALISYGILGGLVTPRTLFFPASHLNYVNFTAYVGIPVQFFRMLLAIVLAVSFFHITNLFRGTIGTVLKAGGLRKKASFVVTVTAAITLFVCISSIYVVSYFTIRRSAGRAEFETARTLATDAAENIKDQVNDLQTYCSRNLWRRACATANQKYSGMDKLQIEKIMRDMDDKWAKAGDQDELIKKSTDGEIPNSMREIMRIRNNISEIFITDKFGGLLFSSGRASDFYQADEDWWQKAFSGGKGAIYFSSIELDLSSGKWGSAIAAPINSSNGDIIGVCKIFVQIDVLFDFLYKFQNAPSVHAALVDEKGAILLREAEPLKGKALTDKKSFEKLKNAADGFIYANSSLNKELSLMARCPIVSEFLRTNGIFWAIAITQNQSEALEPLKFLFFTLILIALFYISLAIPAGAMVGGLISKPIEQLSKVAGLIALGDLDQKINIHTGDEIEQFAETFKNMIFALKISRGNLLRSKDDLEQLTLSQENTIADRTKELSRTQEATMNILEDLVEVKEKLEKYAKELEEAVRVKTDFTATVSHELRTPLAAIKEGIAIVLDGTAGPVETRQKEFLEIARRNADRLARLINDLLDFQKLEAGRMEFNIIKNDINTAIEEAAGAMSTMAAGKGLLFKFDLGKDLPIIEFDKDRMEQVLTNLIGNAIRYTDKGSITLRTEKKDNFIKVSVSDTGIGMKKEDMAKLFQRFSQLEPVSARRVGGTGLGLAISKEIIDHHKGKMAAESEPGKGSTFSFILPIQERRGRI